MLLKSGLGNVIPYTGQAAQIVAPPVMKVVDVGNLSDGTDTIVLEAKADTAYIIHAYICKASNTAGTASTGVGFWYTDFWTGQAIQFEAIDLVANTVQAENRRMSNLNVLTMPGKPVYIHPFSGVAPYSKELVIYYSEVKV